MVSPEQSTCAWSSVRLLFETLISWQTRKLDLSWHKEELIRCRFTALLRKKKTCTILTSQLAESWQRLIPTLVFSRRVVHLFGFDSLLSSQFVFMSMLTIPDMVVVDDLSVVDIWLIPLSLEIACTSERRSNPACIRCWVITQIVSVFQSVLSFLFSFLPWESSVESVFFSFFFRFRHTFPCQSQKK